jgi:predicted dehydrogenase
MRSDTRRNFLKAAAGCAAVPALARSSGKLTPRVLGANDRIQVAVIGNGGRGAGVIEAFHKLGQDKNICQVVGVCDTWQRRVSNGARKYGCPGTLDWREVVGRPDVDAVVVATPDHWHARIAIAAMERGKDVYVEKPMCHTVDEARQMVEAAKRTGRIVQVGSQTTAGDQWKKAKKAIADGMIGPVIMSQGSYHRNSLEGEWNWRIDPQAGPRGQGDDYIDWKTWLGPAPRREWDAERFFRFRKFWDYSGGIATDLFYHVIAPLNLCWPEPQFPYRVMASGGIYAYKDREVPDTFHLMAEYRQGHSLVLSSSLANSQHIPGLIRGKYASLIMVEHGRFEGETKEITVKPERAAPPEFKARFGEAPIQIPVATTDTTRAHVEDFLTCMRTRQKPTLDVETGAKAQVLVSMSVMSYRTGKVLYFDEAKWKVSDRPARA